MKKLFCTLFLISIFISNVSFSANELFRSRVSGSWTTPSTWELSTDNGGTWNTSTVLYPVVTSGATTVRNTYTVTISAGLFLGIDQFTIESGGTLSLGAGSRLTIIGSGQQLLLSGTISGSGSIKTSGAPQFDVRNGSSFNAPLVLDSGDVTIINTNGPNIADIRGSISISSGRNLNVNGGGYSVRAYGNVTNSGLISGSGSAFIMRGSTFTNTGTINSTTFSFDSTTFLDGNGIWNSSNIIINPTGNVTINDTVVFGRTSTVNVFVNAGGKINGVGQYLLLDGTIAQVNMLVNANGTVGISGSTNVHTRGLVSINVRNGGIFNATLNVKTGVTTTLNDNGPNIAVFNGPIVIDAGSTFNVNGGGYTVLARANVVNNGTISGSGSSFTMRGSIFANNSIVGPTTFNFDSTTSLAGTGTWAATNTIINASGKVNLLNNLSFGASINEAFIINTGGVLNPNTHTCTFNGSSGTISFFIYFGGTAFNSGIIQTQGSVNMDFKNGSNFNSPLKINTGQTTAYDDNGPFIGSIYNTLTIDETAIFSVQGGGYNIQVSGNVTNSGTINGSGSAFTMLGNNFINNGTVNPTTFYFSDTTSVSGGGLWDPTNLIISSNAIVSLLNNVGFGGPGSLTFNILSNGILNPNTFTATLNGSVNPVAFVLNNLGLVSNSGVLQTQGNVSVDVRNGAQFFVPFKINTGTSTIYDDNGPFEAVFNNTILVDTGAVLKVQGGGYTLRANEDVTNNGTILGSGSFFTFWSQTFTNNGIVNVTGFYFKGILFSPTYTHVLQGTGSFVNCIVEDGAFVTLASNHQFSYLTINNGGTFDINAKTLKLFGGGTPITVNGFLLTPGSTIEYNGVAAQTLVTSNIAYANLKINDTAGVSCADNFTIPGTLQVISGDLNLNGKIINLLTTGTLSETPGNTVVGTTGYLVATRTLNAPNALNVAGLGAVITTSANLGLTEIRRGQTAQTLPSSMPSIKRYFTIKPVNNTGLNATLIFKYDDSELNGNLESNLMLFKSTNAGANYFLEGGTLNTSLNQITLNNINSFQRYTAGSGVGTLNLTASIEGLYNVATSKLVIRDSILVQLRSTSSPFNVIDSARGVLDSVTLTANLRFTVAPTDTYYVVIKSRNTIETWSKTSGVIYNSGGTASYNFTTAATQAYGNNMVHLGTKWSIYTGDVTQDGSVDLADLAIIDNDAANFTSGYVVSDLNGDYFVDINDAALADNNASQFVSKITP